MFKIGDRIVYGANGVMEIVDVREESIGDVSRNYYVLSSVCSRSDSLIFVPCDNERLLSVMRHLLTREEALELIGRIDKLPVPVPIILRSLWNRQTERRCSV